MAMSPLNLLSSCPLLLLITFGIIDFGLFLWTNIALTRATEAAARCGALNTTPSTTCPDIAAYAASQAWGIDVPSGAFTVTTTTCGLQVSAAYDFNFLTPWFPQFGGSPLGTVTLTPSACYPKQQ